MSADRRRRFRRILAVVATAALLAGAAPAAATPAAATPGWSEVDLTGYRFGRLDAGSTVARAGADQVGYEVPDEGASYGPWSFDVAADGTVWLLDEVNDRLLVWRHGAAAAPDVVRLPYRAAEDFALAADGRRYVDFKPGPPYSRLLYAFSASGAVRWTMPVPREELFNTLLRFGPDGRLYKVDEPGWRPVTTVAGAPLPVAQQRALTLPGQPLPGGRMLTTTSSGTRLEAVLTGPAGAVVRRWRVDVAAPLQVGLAAATAAVRGDDLLLPVEVFGEVGGRYRWELVVLRLSVRTGAVLGRITVQGRGFFGDTITRLRIGPDGAVYELRSVLASGIRVVRHPWAAAVPTPAPTSGTSSGTGTPTAPPTPATGSPSRSSSTAPSTAPSTVPTVTPTGPASGVEAAHGSGSAPNLVAVGAALVAMALVVAGAALYVRRLRGHQPRR